ncbi:MAG: GNAT family N-acetyltransferase [Aerococcus viridans]|nr:MAG: GNAT family N-acetyltransferase [Aerococcus viridans]
MKTVWTNDINSEPYRDALSIRKEVFVKEQGISLDIEVDKYEADCLHMVGYDADNKPVFTARLLAMTPNTVKLQRVAIVEAYRGQGLGHELMAEVEAKAAQENYSQIILGAQKQVTGFYEAMGYNIMDTPEYLDAGIIHVDMQKSLSFTNEYTI